jgi:hypothetical protein
MTEIQAIIVGAIIGGSVALISAFFSYRWARSVSLESIQIVEFNKAAAEFRNAFLPEIIYLNHDAVIEDISGKADNIHGLLRFAYLRRHLPAFEVFRSQLNSDDRSKIDKAWDEYCHPDGIPEDASEKKAFGIDGYFRIIEASGEEEAKRIARENINKLLKFAESK